jgi:NADP-dependent 3-hydroxy acid dehydrogenase YdfG
LIQLQADLLRDQDLLRVIETIDTEHKSFDMLIYAVGGLTAHNIDELSIEDMRYVFQLNTLAPMLIESRLLSSIAANGADVVNITSSSIAEYYPNLTEYSASKIAFQKFTRDLQHAVRDTSARIIEICPSGFESNIYRNMRGRRVERDETIQIPAEELANLIVHVLELPKIMELTHIFVNRKRVNLAGHELTL